MEINNSAYNYIGIDIDGHSYGVWVGNFKITNNSDKEDVAYTSNIRVKVYDDYQSFIEQKIMKNIATDDKEGSIFDVLSIEDLDDFSNALSYYCLNRLTSFYEAIQTAMDTLIEVNQANASAELYEVLYLHMIIKLLLLNFA